MSHEPGALTEVVFYSLLSLNGPLHGDGIIQNVQKLSTGRIQLTAGTLYGVLSTMLEKGWIVELPTDPSDRKKMYQITPIGKQVVRKELKRLEELAANGRKIIEGEFK